MNRLNAVVKNVDADCIQASAGWKPAIQQVGNLRYEGNF